MTANARVKVTRQTFAASGDQPARTVATLAGYPILWNQLSGDRGGYVVRLAPGSASFTSPALALFHHDPQAVLGSTASGTLRVGQPDDVGVPIEIDLPDTTTGNDLAVLVGRGDISGMSFSMANGFEDYAESREGGVDVLTCSRFTCDEITVTATPAFTGTTIGVKADDDPSYSRSATARAAASIRLAKFRLHMAAPGQRSAS